jgi:hypothetical protein
MKNFRPLVILVFLLTSCSSTSKFPVSSTVPAADISVKKSMDKNNNHEINITADNLASPERLSPPRGAYVVWITTADKGLKNLGQLQNKNAKKATLKTITAFEPLEIFITAESTGDISYPEGLEIARISFGGK